MITVTGENLLIGLICGAASPPPDLYLALLTLPATPYSSGWDIAEPTVAEYKRIKIQNSPGSWIISEGEMVNAQAIDLPFAYSLEPWPILVGWGLLDAETGGSLFWAGGWTPVQPTAQDYLSIPKGALAIRAAAAGGWSG